MAMNPGYMPDATFTIPPLPFAAVPVPGAVVTVASVHGDVTSLTVKLPVAPTESI
jgi:hypothetical protein